VLSRTAWPFDGEGFLVDGEIGESGFQDTLETGLKLSEVAWAVPRKPRNGPNEVVMINTEENLTQGGCKVESGIRIPGKRP
jgi:hypothetical protein